MQIDHNHHEPSRKALKLIGVLTAVIVLAAGVIMSASVGWTVRQFPPTLTSLLAGAIIGASIGFFLGRRDAIRQFRISGRDE